MLDYENHKHNHKGIILDGIPRNIDQANFIKDKFSWENSLFVNIYLQ